MQSNASPPHDATLIRGLRWRFLLWGLVALFIVQTLYGVLILSTLHKQYRTPMLTVQALACDELALRLGRMARLGKPLERIHTIDELLAATQETTHAATMLVTLPTGQVVGSWNPQQVGTVFPLPQEKKLITGTASSEFEQGDSLWIVRPIFGRQEKVAGYVYLQLLPQYTSALLRSALEQQPWIFLVALGSYFLLAGLCFGLFRQIQQPQNTQEDSSSRIRLLLSTKRARMVLLIPLLTSMLLCMLFMRAPLSQLHVQQSMEMGTHIAHQLARELSSIVDKGFMLENLPGVEKHLMEIQHDLTRVNAIGVFDSLGNLLFATTRNGTIPRVKWQALQKIDVSGSATMKLSDGLSVGTVHVLMSSAAIAENIFDTLLDTATVAAIALILMLELTVLLILQAERSTIAKHQALADMPRFMRPIIFFALFAITFSVSFIPLRLAELDTAFLGLPRDVVMGLPMSFEMLMTGIAILLGGAWGEKQGWRPMLMCGVALAALGYCLSGLAQSAPLFILARGVAGAGYGFINLGAQVFVVSQSTKADRASNLGTLFAGLYAGAVCGSATGGLLADRLGYAPVFFVAATLLLMLWCILFFCRPVKRWQSTAVQPQAQRGIAWRAYWAFLTDARMGTLLLCNIIPIAFMTICLSQFFIPVQLSSSGSSPSDIGRVFMTSNLLIALLIPLSGRIADATDKKHWILALGGGIATLAAVAFMVGSGMSAALASVFFLGLANALVLATQGAYALLLPASRTFGESRSVGVYNIAERLGQVLGPISFGIILALWGQEAGIAFLAFGMAGASILFFIVANLSPQKEPLNKE